MVETGVLDTMAVTEQVTMDLLNMVVVAAVAVIVFKVILLHQEPATLD
jgi:hypothetical protein